MTAEEKKEALLRWNEHCQRLLRLTSKRKPETEAERKENIARALKDYDYFCQRYLSHYCQCPNAKFHNEAARYIEKHREMEPFSSGRADMPNLYTWTWESLYG